MHWIFIYSVHFYKKKNETLSKHVNTALNGQLVCTPMKLLNGKLLMQIMYEKKILSQLAWIGRAHMKNIDSFIFYGGTLAIILSLCH